MAVFPRIFGHRSCISLNDLNSRVATSDFCQLIVTRKSRQIDSWTLAMPRARNLEAEKTGEV